MRKNKTLAISGRKQKFGVVDLIAHLLMIIVTCLILYPMLHTVAVSFSGNNAIMRNEVTIFPKEFTLQSYAHFLEEPKVLRAYKNTIIYTVVGVSVSVIMTTLMAYPLSKHNLIGRSVIMKLIMFTMYFNGGTIPTYLLITELGLIDSMWSLVLPNAIWTMEMIIMINFYRSIPTSLYEAAYLDGASEFQVFFKLALPLSKASISSISLFFFMGFWNSYFAPMLYLQDPKKFPLQVILRSIVMENSESQSASVSEALQTITPTGIKNAVIVITMLPVLIVYPFAQKYFVKGVMVGSVKG